MVRSRILDSSLSVKRDRKDIFIANPDEGINIQDGIRSSHSKESSSISQFALPRSDENDVASN